MVTDRTEPSNEAPNPVAAYLQRLLVRISTPSEDPGEKVDLPLPLLLASQRYGLSTPEVELLAYALGTELDLAWAKIWQELGGGLRPRLGDLLPLVEPDALKQAVLLEGLAGAGPLARNALIELRGAGPLMTRELALGAGLAPRLAGAPQVSALGRLLPPLPGLSGRLLLSESLRESVDQASRALLPNALVTIQGGEGSGRATLARAVASGVGLCILQVSVEQLESQLERVRRDALWWGAAVLVTGERCPARALRELELPLIWVCGRQTPLPGQIASIRRSVQLHSPRWRRPEREALWARFCEGRLEASQLQELASRYHYGPGRVEEVVLRARRRGQDLSTSVPACAQEVQNVHFGGLAQRIEGPRHWKDLVLSPELRQELDLALTWVRKGRQVFGEWGLGDGPSGSLGLTCLLHGPPGTGKTLAARVLATELELPLYRVDLSQILNKYIGETEKKLGRLFDEAATANAMLLFDEADALFGKRTEVKDANDRYANVETGYLLQRLEAHDGPVLLTTNLLSNLDGAFLRRLHVVAEFKRPGPRQLERIWRLHLPKVCGEVDLAFLTHGFELSGAEVRSVCLVAGLLAAQRGETVEMPHLVLGLCRELKKSGRLVQSTRFGPFRALVEKGHL